MSNLDNLTSKIISDAENKAQCYLSEARGKELKIINDKKIKAERDAEEILESAKNECISIVERALSKTELEMRNRKLSAKQQMIDKIFQLAEKRLNDMKLEDYREYVMKSILALDISGDEEIVISNTDRAKLSSDFLQELNNKLGVMGKLSSMKYSEDECNYSGFILRKNGIEINYSFNSLISTLRDELEYEVSKILFCNI